MNHSSFQVMLLNVFLIMTKLLKKKKSSMAKSYIPSMNCSRTGGKEKFILSRRLQRARAIDLKMITYKCNQWGFVL